MADRDYKQDAIEKSLDWIRQHFEDLLGFSENPDEQLDFLKNQIKELYLKHQYSTDMSDACFNVINRRIQEALDTPLDKLTPLLMENVSTGPRRVTRRLYYPEAGHEEKE